MHRDAQGIPDSQKESKMEYGGEYGSAGGPGVALGSGAKYTIPMSRMLVTHVPRFAKPTMAEDAYSDYSYSYGSEDDEIPSGLEELSASAGSPFLASKAAPASDARAPSKPKHEEAPVKSAKVDDEYEYTYSEPGPTASDPPSPVHSRVLSPAESRSQSRSNAQLPAATNSKVPLSTTSAASALLPAAPASQFDVCIAPPSGLLFEYDDAGKKLKVLSVNPGSSADGIVLPVCGPLLLPWSLPRLHYYYCTTAASRSCYHCSRPLPVRTYAAHHSTVSPCAG